MNPLLLILALAALRRSSSAALGQIWRALPSYDRADVDQWLSEALPLVDGARRHSAALTNAYIASAMERGPFELDVDALIGNALRNGAKSAEVYERAFVTVWTALGDEGNWEQATAQGLDRATSAIETDVQLSMRAAAEAIDIADPTLYGYRRVANPTACTFCREVDGAYVKGSDGFVLALHNHCGCGIQPLKEPHSGAAKLPDGTEVRPFQTGALNENVAVQVHGELGPVLVDPTQHFTPESALH
jgi:hypothetical protein